MPVQVPKVGRNTSIVGPASVGRIEAQAPDLSSTLRQGQAAGSLVNEIGETVNKEINYHADTTAQAAASEFDQFINNELEGPNGAKYKTGDPTKIYEELDVKIETKRKELEERYKDSYGATREAVGAKLADTNRKFYDRRVSAFGTQMNTYQKGVTNASVEIAKNDMMDSVAHLDISDPNALVGLDNVINNIKDLRLKSGLKNGSVREIKDEKTGEVIGFDSDPTVKLEMAKDIGDGLYRTIENLNTAGDVEGAKYITERYKQYIDPINKERIAEKTQKAERDVNGMKLFDRVRNLPPERALAEINKETNPEVREKALAKYDTNQRLLDNAKKRQDTGNYQAIGKIILDRQKSGSSFVTVDQMMSDPAIKQMIGNIKDPKKITALANMVTQPKDSDPAALAFANNVLFENDEAQGVTLRGMSQDDFNELVAGLSKRDRNYFENQWRRYNSQTEGEDNQRHRLMGSQLSKSLIQYKLIKKNDFGKLDNKNEIKFNQYSQEFNEMVDKLPKAMTNADMKKAVNEFVAKKAIGETFDPTKFQTGRFQGSISDKKKRQPPPATSTAFNENEDTRRRKASSQYFREFGTFPKVGSGQLEAYMKQKGL